MDDRRDDDGLISEDALLQMGFTEELIGSLGEPDEFEPYREGGTPIRWYAVERVEAARADPQVRTVLAAAVARRQRRARTAEREADALRRDAGQLLEEMGCVSIAHAEGCPPEHEHRTEDPRDCGACEPVVTLHRDAPGYGTEAALTEAAREAFPSRSPDDHQRLAPVGLKILARIEADREGKRSEYRSAVVPPLDPEEWDGRFGPGQYERPLDDPVRRAWARAVALALLFEVRPEVLADFPVPLESEETYRRAAKQGRKYGRGSRIVNLSAWARRWGIDRPWIIEAIRERCHADRIVERFVEDLGEAPDREVVKEALRTLREAATALRREGSACAYLREEAMAALEAAGVSSSDRWLRAVLGSAPRPPDPDPDRWAELLGRPEGGGPAFDVVEQFWTEYRQAAEASGSTGLGSHWSHVQGILSRFGLRRNEPKRGADPFRHFRWLIEACVPGEPGGRCLSFVEIANAEDPLVTKQAVEKAVKKLAAEIDFPLPEKDAPPVEKPPPNEAWEDDTGDEVGAHILRLKAGTYCGGTGRTISKAGLRALILEHHPLPGTPPPDVCRRCHRAWYRDPNRRE